MRMLHSRPHARKELRAESGTEQAIQSMVVAVISNNEPFLSQAGHPAPPSRRVISSIVSRAQPGTQSCPNPRPSVGRVQGRPSPQPRATGASSAGTGPGVPGPPPRDREPPRAGVHSDPLEPASRLHWQGFWSFRVTRRMKLTQITLKGL